MGCHPLQADAYLTAWENKQKREEYRIATNHLVTFQAAGVKIRGRRPTLDDFLPKYARSKKDDDDPTGELALMAEADAALAKQKK